MEIIVQWGLSYLVASYLIGIILFYAVGIEDGDEGYSLYAHAVFWPIVALYSLVLTLME